MGQQAWAASTDSTSECVIAVCENISGIEQAMDSAPMDRGGNSSDKSSATEVSLFIHLPIET